MFSMTKRNERYFPKGSIIVRPKGLDAILGLYEYVQNKNGFDITYYGVIGYVGKQTKPTVYEARRVRSQRDDRAAVFVENVRKHNEWLAEQQAGRKIDWKRFTAKPGDIYYTSWGYDQTNVEFYEIVEIRGAYAYLRELKTDTTGWDRNDSESLTPRPGDYSGEPIRRKMLTRDNGVTISFKITESANAWLWDGKPLTATHYA